MPIEFACGCGKAFKVADEYAGKRSKCTACGQPVVVPSPTPPAAAEESAEDAAMRALTEDSEPQLSDAGRAEPPAPRPMSLPAATCKPQTTARKDLPPTYRSNPDTPTKKKRPPNWAKVGGGVAMAVVGVLVGVGAMVVYFGGGSMQRWAFIIPVPLVLAAPFFIIDGFRDRAKK